MRSDEAKFLIPATGDTRMLTGMSSHMGVWTEPCQSVGGRGLRRGSIGGKA